MSEEIQQAIQIIRVAYDGIEIAMKIGSSSLEQMKQAVDFLVTLLEHEKTMGKTSMRKLLLKGGDLQVLQFASEDLKQVKKIAKKYGLLYSIVPKADKKGDMCEIIFHMEAIPRVNMMVQKLKNARIVNFDEYLKGGKKNEVEKQISFLREKESFNSEDMSKNVELMKKIGKYICEKQNIHTEKIKEHFSITTEQVEKVLAWLKQMGIWEQVENNKPQVLMKKEDFLKLINKYQELVQRIRNISAIQGGSLVNVIIPKKLIMEGNDVGYLWMKKENVMDIHDGKTILTFLDTDKEYKIYSEDNRILRTMKGNELYEGHYDKVEKEVRKRYQQTERKTVVKAKRKTITPKKR